MGALSFDASLKVPKSKAGGYLKHLERTENDGINHSNEMINSDLTKYNIGYSVNDERARERFKSRLEQFETKREEFNASDYKKDGKRARRALKDDSVVMRGLVFAPPVESFQNDTIEHKKEVMNKFANDVFAWYIKEFGVETFVSANVHLDETSPHLHIAMCPLTEDGRMSQKDFFKNPRDMKRMHKELREHMNENGWNVDTENKYVDAKHYNDKEYKENAEEIENNRGMNTSKYNKRNKELDKKINAVEEKTSKLNVLEKNLQQQQQSLAMWQIQLADKQKELEEKEILLQQKVERAQKQYRKADFDLEL